MEPSVFSNGGVHEMVTLLVAAGVGDCDGPVVSAGLAVGTDPLFAAELAPVFDDMPSRLQPASIPAIAIEVRVKAHTGMVRERVSRASLGRFMQSSPSVSRLDFRQNTLHQLWRSAECRLNTALLATPLSLLNHCAFRDRKLCAPALRQVCP